MKPSDQVNELAGAGRRGRPQVSETKKLIQLHFAQCMRKHGVPNFPDPTFPTGGGISQPDVPGLNLNLNPPRNDVEGRG
jgi:hypothetical protein